MTFLVRRPPAASFAILRRRKAGHYLLALTLVLISSAAAFADTIKITTDRALVWNRPSGLAVVITQLKRDDTVEVVRKLNGWYEIIVPGNSMSTEVRTDT